MTNTTALDPVIAAVLARSIVNDESRENWLGGRRTRLTATDMKIVNRSREQTVREHLRKKADGTDAVFAGNRATEFGKWCEAELIRDHVGTGWVRGGDLIGHPENDRFASTPDLMGVSFLGELELREVKSSNKDLDPSGAAFAATRYLEQILWQIYTTGAARVYLDVIVHDDDWSRWADRPSREWEYPDGTNLGDYAPKIIAKHEYVFEAADYVEQIAAMVKKAETALVWLDEIATGIEADGVEKFTPEQVLEYGEIARRYAKNAEAEKKAKAAKDEAKAELIAKAIDEERRGFSETFDTVKVTYSPETTETPEVDDMEAALAAAPALAAELAAAADALTAAKLAYDSQREQWEAHQAKHRKPGEPVKSPAKVTATPKRGMSYV